MSEINAIATNNYILQAPLPSSTMSTTALEYDVDNKISGYAGSAFAGGVPSATSGYWQDASDVVNSSSGAWGGSALPISAGPGIKVNLVDNTLVFSNDETVLWSGDASHELSVTTGAWSETLSNFERVRMYWSNNDAGSYKCSEYPTEYGLEYLCDCAPNGQWWKGITVVVNNTGFSDIKCWELTNGSPTTGTQVNYFHFMKLVGINRIAGE